MLMQLKAWHETNGGNSRITSPLFKLLLLVRHLVLRGEDSFFGKSAVVSLRMPLTFSRSYEGDNNVRRLRASHDQGSRLHTNLYSAQLRKFRVSLPPFIWLKWKFTQRRARIVRATGAFRILLMST